MPRFTLSTQIRAGLVKWCSLFLLFDGGGALFFFFWWVYICHTGFQNQGLQKGFFLKKQRLGNKFSTKLTWS